MKEPKFNIPPEEEKKIRKAIDEMLPDEKNWEQIYHDSWIKSHNKLVEIGKLIDEYRGKKIPKKTNTNQ